MLISQLCEILDVEAAQLSVDRAVTSFIYDSRRATGSQDELFIALQGAQKDGHAYIEQLYNKGCRNFLISDDVSLNDYPEANFIAVEDSLQALQQIVGVHRSQFKIPVAGITGSNGKTIVKEWLSTLLLEAYQLVKSPKSYNSQLGVPLSVWEVNSAHEVAVFEAGISVAGEMHNLEKIIRPTIGVFTNLGEAHNSGFQNRAEKLKEKAKLFESTQTNICRLSHVDIVNELVEKSGKLITWEQGDDRATINILKKETGFSFLFGEEEYLFEIDLVNALDLENIFHAVVTALIIGESPEAIQRGLDKIKPIPMRLELKRGLNDCYILDDSYNNDLFGLGIALDYLKQQPRKQSKVVVLSDILQSGKATDTLYTEVNQLLRNHQVDLLIGIGEHISAAADKFSMSFQGFPNTESFIKTAPQFASQTILVKGARDFHLESVVSYLEEKNHGTVLEVNYESLLHNLSVYRQKLTPETKLMVMVKAFAYGIGVDEIAHLLQYHQVDYLGVAYLDEAINLRRKGIAIPIMIMNVDWESFGLVETFELEPEIYSLPMLKKYLIDCKKPSPIHLKIETGMNRLGFDKGQLPELIEILKDNPQLKVAGISTHFASAEDSQDDDFTNDQAQRLEEAYSQIVAAIGYHPTKHALNSAGIVRWPQYHFDMVRLGIGLYGFDSSSSLDNLKVISTLKTKVSQIKTVSEGDSIGYNRKGRLSQKGKIATVAIGYADGYGRGFGNGKAYMLINGQKAYTVGNVCMDMTMLDVTDLQVAEGDEVIVFGENPPIQLLAQWIDTIPYEILTNVSQRVKRVFVSE